MKQLIMLLLHQILKILEHHHKQKMIFISIQEVTILVKVNKYKKIQNCGQEIKQKNQLHNLELLRKVNFHSNKIIKMNL